MLGLQSFWTARRTLAGAEAMAMLAKGKVRAVPAKDMPAQCFCRELGVTRQTLYRPVGPTGELREDGRKLLQRPRR